MRVSESNMRLSINSNIEFPLTLYNYDITIPKKIESTVYKETIIINNQVELEKYNKEHDMLSPLESKMMLDSWSKEELTENLRNIYGSKKWWKFWK